MFDRKLAFAENCTLRGEPYRDERRAEFLEYFEPHLKEEAIHRLLAWYDNGLTGIRVRR